MNYWRIPLLAVLLISSCSTSAFSVDYGLPEYMLVDGHPAPFTQPLNPEFQRAAEDFNIPVELLLALGYFGSNFENRAYAPTIEKGYGLMALREGGLASESLAEAQQLTGLTNTQLKLEPASSIRGAAAVLDSYAKAQRINRDLGLDAWLGPVITYAGLDEECSRMFAGEVYSLLQKGLVYTNRAGERFIIAPQKTAVDIDDLYGDTTKIASTDYGPAVWDPAPSCNMSTGSYSKDTIVIHTVEGSYAGCISWVKNCNSNVSVQYVIAYDGRITQMVRDYGFAWHAGCYNARAIGYEHEGYAAAASHPTAQYNASALLSREICNERGIPKAHRSTGPGILGHVDVTRCCCGTHTDPGNGWDWGYYINTVNGTPSGPALDSAYNNQSYTATMEAGSTAIVWVEYKNTGTSTWNYGQVRLGTSNPQDRSSAFFTSGNWVNAARPTEMDVSSCGPGGVARFTFIMTAPSTPGTYTEYWRLVKEGTAWFGYSGVYFNITVVPKKGNLTGTVRNSVNSAAISGATVSLSGVGNATTNASGTYTFSNINAATYNVSVTAGGFNPANASVTVAANATTTKDFSLTPTDTQVPSTPTGLAAVAVSPSQINLTWNASTDNVGVTGYRVYRGGTEIGTAVGTSYQDNGLPANTAFSYTVKARDAANNLSGASNTASATTFPGSVPIFEDGFANLNYWESIVQPPMTGPNPMALTGDKDHGTFDGINAIRSVANGTGNLIGHRFVPAFAQAKFETWFFDGAGVGYTAPFERGTEGWVSYTLAYATLSKVGGGSSGSCLQASDGGWTSGVYKEITTGFAAGQSFSLTMASKWPAPPAGKSYSTPPRCFVRFFDGAGAEISTAYSGNITTDNVWRGYGVSGTVPAGTAKIWIGHWGVLGASSTYTYFADSVSFTTNAGAAVNNTSRQGLQVRCLTPEDGIKAIYMLGCYSVGGPTGSAGQYSVGYYKVCGTGCTNWYWTYNVKPRTAGWHKLTLDFLPYTGSGDIKAYIDGSLVATLDRTADTEIFGLNMVGYGFHYGVNTESWYDDVAMYAQQPHPAPTAGVPQTLGPNSIRWNFTDNSNNEIGFKVQDSSNVIKGVTGALTGTGQAGSIVETGLAPNTQYTRILRAYNGSLDSFASVAVSAWTAPATVSEAAIECNKQAGVWYNTSDFTFTAVGGFGEGTVDHYDYYWSPSATYTFVGGEPVWNSGDLLLSLPGDGEYYLHAKAFGSDGSSSGSVVLGPFRFDGSAPGNPSSATEDNGAQDGVYQTAVSDPSFSWPAATDSLSGIAGYSVYFGDDPNGEAAEFVTSPAFDAPAVSATGEYYLRVRARDGAGNDAAKWVTLFTFKYSADKPSTPQVSDDGPYSPPTDKVHVIWTASNSVAGIVDYQYAVGTTDTTQDVADWTSAGDVNEAFVQVAGGLVSGNTYYVFVKAKDATDQWSDVGVSDGIQLVEPIGKIGLAKGLPDGTPVALEGKIISATLNAGDYIQELDRASGIRVASSLGQAGSTVSVAGVMATVNHERVIDQAALVEESQPQASTMPIPLRFQIAQLAGEAFNAYTEGITGGLGLNSVGLLVAVNGWVDAVTADSFTVNDGSPLSLTVVRGAEMDLSGWTTGDFVQVLGICTLTEENGTVLPMLRLRHPDDAIKLN